jgi:glyoxylase-like metal-dependent hydrolase (beta-lactamase superfamily II)
MKKEILLGLLLGAVVTGSFAQENGGLFSFKVGAFEVYMMEETRRPGNADVLVGADEALVKRYIPAAGFTSATNTFLIKAPGRNILVDTGYGRALFDHMKKLGVAPEQVDAVLLTHMHGDHIGGLQKDGTALFPKAKVYVAKRELDYWTKTNVNQGAVAAMAAYNSRVETFEPGALNGKLAELLPGITPIAAYGHTPGHTVFLLENGGAKFMIWGDIMHVELVQFPSPGTSVRYDSDPQAAAASRRSVLDYAAKTNSPSGACILCIRPLER